MQAAIYTVAVRELCEFTAKQGDLDLRFTPSPSSQEGVAGHKSVAARRSGSYRAEISLSGPYKHLLVRGRADGYDADRQTLEEVKTYKGHLDRMPAHHQQLHWAQAKVYGWLLCREYSAELTHADLRHVRTLAPVVLKKPLDRLHRAWNAITQGRAGPYRAHADVPSGFVSALQDTSAAITELLA